MGQAHSVAFPHTRNFVTNFSFSLSFADSAPPLPSSLDFNLISVLEISISQQRSISYIIKEKYRKIIIVPVLQLMTCVQFVGLLVILPCILVFLICWRMDFGLSSFVDAFHFPLSSSQTCAFSPRSHHSPIFHSPLFSSSRGVWKRSGVFSLSTCFAFFHFSLSRGV